MRPVLLYTRPKQATSLVFDDIDVIDLPLLRLHCFGVDKLSCDDKDAMLAFMAGSFDVVVVVSTEAAYGAMRFLQTHNIHHASELGYRRAPIFIAVGQATKDALAQFGFCAITPDVMSNEGMLAMSEINGLNSQHRVLIWRGVGGRRVLHNALVERGTDVRAIAWYQRQIPDELPSQYQQLITTLPDGAPIFVLITSQLSLQAWTALPHRRPFVCLPLGNRLCRLTQAQCPNADIVQLNNLKAEHIHQAITAYQKSAVNDE